MSELEFANLPVLALLAALPLLGYWMVRSARRPVRPVLLLPSLGAVRDLAERPPHRRWVALTLRLIALALLVVALARPRAGKADAIVQSQGIDIMLAVDVSRSMLETIGDADQDKLSIVKTVIDQFIAQRPDDRMGMVQFQAEAFQVSPLTLDHDALRRLLQDVRNGRLAEGTAIGSGLAASVDALRDSTARSRVVILLTDGENNSGDIDPVRAARIAKALGIHLYTIGISRASADGLQGVDERTLREMANIADGQYFAATDPQGLASIYQTIGQLETSAVGGREFTAFNEYAPYFLVAALIVLLAERLLAATVARRAP